MSDTFLLHSPRPVEQVRERLKDRVANQYLGSLVELSGGGLELFGRIRGNRVRLERPHPGMTLWPRLVGTLDAADDGGTLLTAVIEYPGSRCDEDVEYLTRALNRIAGFNRVA